MLDYRSHYTLWFARFTGWWFVNVDDFNEGWVPATYLEPLYGAHDDEAHTQILSPGEGEEGRLEGRRGEDRECNGLSFETTNSL